MATLTVHRLPQFDVLYNMPKDTEVVVVIGSRGGAKTYEVSKFTAYSATIKKKRAIVLRDEKERIRESILGEILQRFDTANANGALSAKYDRLDTGLKHRESGEMVVFTQGFRASTIKKKANMKGVTNVDLAIVEEAEDIIDQDKFNTFADSIRKEGAVIILLLNTPDIQHWIVKRYFNLELVEDGYWRLIPRKMSGVVIIQTNFEDNPFLAPHIVARYRSYGDVNSPLYNPHYYKTAILGLASSGRKGQVHKKVKAIPLAEYMALPYKEIFGQDFGTASPAGLVGVKIHKNNCYCRQINYLPMHTLDIAKLYCRLKFDAKDKIVADCADEKAIEKLSSGYTRQELSAEDIGDYPELVKGFYIVPCVKGKDSLAYGISLMDSLNLFAVEESGDLWNEVNNRIYATDKGGFYTNDPEPGWDHLIDPWMYVAVDVYGSQYTKSNLTNKLGYFR